MIKRIGNRAERIRRLPPGHADRQSLLSSRTPVSSSMIRFVQPWTLTDEEDRILEDTGLISVKSLSHIEPDMAQLTALAEKWNAERNTFLLPTGEITVTLEDVYRIMRVPINGDQARQLIARQLFVSTRGAELAEWLTASPDYHVSKGCSVRAALKDLPDSIPRIRLVIAAIISYLVYPDKSSDFFPLGMVHIVRHCVEDRKRYAWGKTILAHLYRDLTRCTVNNGKSIFHAPLLQIWALEHIKISRPLHCTPHDNSVSKFPFWERWASYDYRLCVHFDVEYWRSKFEGLDNTEVVWRPYLEFVGWDEDLHELEKVDLRADLHCRCKFYEKYWPDRVRGQFKSTHDVADTVGENWQLFLYGDRENVQDLVHCD